MKGGIFVVKGVNKTVIEVNNTGSKFFEKIVFYVTPQYGNLNTKQLLRETDNFTFNFAERADRGYKTLRKRMRRKRMLFFCGAMAVALVAVAVALVVIL